MGRLDQLKLGEACQGVKEADLWGEDFIVGLNAAVSDGEEAKSRESRGQ
jgi:hypothetical protein